MVRLCAWCRLELRATHAEARFCSQKCRQAAFRLRRRSSIETHNSTPLRLAYADPPYPGTARKYYSQEPSYRGEVDHRALIASLMDGYDGWALSTSHRALRAILPLCPEKVRVCPWVKPIGVSRQTYGLHNTWEPLLVMPARELRPGKRDWLYAHPARRGGDLPGRKPLAFAAWLFECLGALPGDSLEDLYPGTGIISRAWRELSRASMGDVSGFDPSLEALSDRAKVGE